MYEERAKRKRDELAAQLTTAEGGIREIEQQLGTEAARRRNLQEAKAAHAATLERLQSAEKLLEEVNEAPSELKAAQDKLNRETALRERHARELDNVRGRMKANAERIHEFETVLVARDDIQHGYDALQTAREADQTLSQKLSELSGINEALAKLRSTINEARVRLEGERDTLNKDLVRLQQQIDTVDTSEHETVRAQLADLEQKSHQRDETQAALAKIKEEFAECRATNEALRDTMNELKERIDTLSEVEDAACPLCGQPLTDTHRQELLAELTTEGKAQGDTFRANVTRMETIEADKATLSTTVKELADTLADLPRLQKRAGELQAQAEAADEARRQLESARQHLKEVEAALETETYAAEARAELAIIEAQKTELGYDKSAHDEHRETLAQYSEYEALQLKLRVAEESLPPLQERQTEDEQFVVELQQTLAEDDATLKQLEAEVLERKARVALYHQRHQETLQLRTEERQADNKVVSAQHEVDSLGTLRERKKTLEARREALSEQRSIYEELRVAFGKNGVPAMIIETAIPELEAISNDLLGRMTNSRMRVRFSTQREKVTGGVSETLDIDIADELGTRNYELYSGGEAFRINFAIRVALSKLLARRAGAHLETLFIDEGFGTQDEEGRTKLVDAINAIKNDFDLILVITHIDDLKDMFPVHINIQKTAQGSLVDVI